VWKDEETYISSFSTSTSTSLTSVLINSTLLYSVLPHITLFIPQPSPPLAHPLSISLTHSSSSSLFHLKHFRSLTLPLSLSLSLSLTHSLSLSLLPSLSLSSPFDQHIDLPPSYTLSLFLSEFRNRDKHEMKLTTEQK
jgi:hypothetical protein